MGYFKRFYTAGKPPPSTGVVEEKPKREVFQMAVTAKSVNPVSEAELKEGAVFPKERLLKTPLATLLKVLVRVHKQTAALQSHAKSDVAKLTDVILGLQTKKVVAAPAAPKTTAKKEEPAPASKVDVKKDPVAYRKGLVAIVVGKLKPAGSDVKVLKTDTIEQIETKVVDAVTALGESGVDVDFDDKTEVPYLEAAGLVFDAGAEETGAEETGTEETGAEETGEEEGTPSTDEDAGAAAAAEESGGEDAVDPEKVKSLISTIVTTANELAAMLGIDLGNG